MTQNFRRRITLQTNPFYEFQKSSKKYKEIDYLEKADSDTFIKSTVNKITPTREKKINPFLLETPKIEQEKQRRISIYFPLSFNQKSDIKNNNYDITNVTNEVYADLDKDDGFLNFDFFPLKKVKKTLESNKINKKTYKEIEFYDERNKKYKFGLFKDNNIFDKDFSVEKEGLYFNNRINCGESTDDDKKENDCKRCINILKDGIEFYSNNPGFISRNINNNK